MSQVLNSDLVTAVDEQVKKFLLATYAQTFKKNAFEAHEKNDFHVSFKHCINELNEAVIYLLFTQIPTAVIMDCKNCDDEHKFFQPFAKQKSLTNFSKAFLVDLLSVHESLFAEYEVSVGKWEGEWGIFFSLDENLDVYERLTKIENLAKMINNKVSEMWHISLQMVFASLYNWVEDEDFFNDAYASHQMLQKLYSLKI